ncbi:hypothetical protein Nepgr_031702 [Nepenthes gracilis]|uniref:Uncharacterized protein n=1 Tax=Nepenthes gracilis TaxID=150966 RepID=A0AAD3TIM9_NEPGR|nr:hypothetical protein Nepgr_031702 [Nepenthes gracilis]
MPVWCHADMTQLPGIAELRIQYAVSLAGMVLAIWWACRDMFFRFGVMPEQIGPCSLQRAGMKILVISAFDRGTCKMPLCNRPRWKRLCLLQMSEMHTTVMLCIISEEYAMGRASFDQDLVYWLG